MSAGGKYLLRRIELINPKSSYFSSPWMSGWWAWIKDQKIRTVKKRISSKRNIFHDSLNDIKILGYLNIKMMFKIRKTIIVKIMVISVKGRIFKNPRTKTI